MRKTTRGLVRHYECPEFLFQDLVCMEKGYDLSERRRNKRGHWANGMDSVPVDSFGGFRENWAVYRVGRKGGGPDLPRYKDSSLEHARFCRMDTRGTVTGERIVSPSRLPAPLRGPFKRVKRLFES